MDLDAGYLFNSKGKTKSAKRIIPLTDRSVKVIKSRLSVSPGEYLSVNVKTGKPFTTLKTAHAGALKRSAVKRFRPYDLRHTFATRFVESGGGLTTLKELLGYSTIQMVMRYAHPTEQHKFDAIRRIEKKFAKGESKALKMSG